MSGRRSSPRTRRRRCAVPTATCRASSWSRARSRSARSRSPSPLTWRDTLNDLATHPSPAVAPVSTAGREVLYLLDVPATLKSQRLSIQLLSGWQNPDGSWERLSPLSMNRDDIPGLPNSADQTCLSLLATLGAGATRWSAASYTSQIPARCEVPPPAATVLLPLLSTTGRFRARRKKDSNLSEPVAWEEGRPWEVWLEVREEEGGDSGSPPRCAGGTSGWAPSAAGRARRVGVPARPRPDLAPRGRQLPLGLAAGSREGPAGPRRRPRRAARPPPRRAGPPPPRPPRIDALRGGAHGPPARASASSPPPGPAARRARSSRSSMKGSRSTPALPSTASITSRSGGSSCATARRNGGAPSACRTSASAPTRTRSPARRR